MTVNFNDYKKRHKSGDQKELERLDQASEEAFQDMDTFTNQMMKYNNLPEGTQGDPEDINILLILMGRHGQAAGDYKAQQRKMELRPWEDKNREQSDNKIVSYKA